MDERNYNREDGYVASDRRIKSDSEDERMDLEDGELSDGDSPIRPSSRQIKQEHEDSHKKSKKIKAETIETIKYTSKRQEESEEEELYCICRSSDGNRFMICCDACEVWYHGDCINVTKAESKKILKFFCKSCQSKDGSLEIEYKQPPAKAKKKNVPESESFYSSIKKESISSVTLDSKMTIDLDYRPKLKKSKMDYSSEDDDDYSYKGRSSKKSSKAKSQSDKKKTKSTKKSKTSTPKYNSSSSRKAALGGSGSGRRHKRDSFEERSEIRQCWGPGCTLPTRDSKTKYCSDECGIALARSRLYEILPDRVNLWQSIPSVADEHAHRDLDAIRADQERTRCELEELDSLQRDLSEIIDRAKTAEPLTEEEEDDLLEDDTDALDVVTYCVTCGQEVNMRTANKHMERCFNKYESQSSFGSVFKTKIEGQTVFCDEFNREQGTYCKRLRIMCPEHSRDPKVGDDEVCGCPLVADVFEATDNFCRIRKRNCNRHFSWEKFRIAELDLRRLVLWLKMEELFEREQRIRYTMAGRGGVMSLLLHQTTPAIPHGQPDDSQHREEGEIQVV